MGFDNKIAVVTGGGSGIGRAICKALSEAGARVAVVDRDAEGARETAEGHCRAGTAIAVAADVTDEGQVSGMVAEVTGKWGRLDLLHNHAGILHPNDASILDITAAAIDETLAVNVRGQMLVAKHVGRSMAATGGGAIVNTSSDLAFIALGNVCSYVTSKAAILGLTRAMAVDLAPHHIRVNAVCPGFVYSGMTAGLAENAAIMDAMRKDYLVPQLGEPGDVAGAVLFLLSDEARFVTGSSLMVDGGHTVR
jgi:NAD(P)-dependent dehydrogenase (short-subunit alcohol dehydrogenase family)